MDKVLCNLVITACSGRITSSISGLSCVAFVKWLSETGAVVELEDCFVSNLFTHFWMEASAKKFLSHKLVRHFASIRQSL